MLDDGFGYLVYEFDLGSMARKLRVAHVLEGSVRREGNRVRVTARLVAANGGYQPWAETYDREMTDVFSVQDEIARAVTSALRLKLLPGEAPRPRSAAPRAPRRTVEALLRRLRAEEAALRDLRARRTAPSALAAWPAAPEAPSAERLRELWDDLEGTLRAAPREAQQALQARLGTVVLSPASRRDDLPAAYGPINIAGRPSRAAGGPASAPASAGDTLRVVRVSSTTRTLAAAPPGSPRIVTRRAHAPPR